MLFLIISRFFPKCMYSSCIFSFMEISDCVKYDKETLWDQNIADIISYSYQLTRKPYFIFPFYGKFTYNLGHKLVDKFLTKKNIDKDQNLRDRNHFLKQISSEYLRLEHIGAYWTHQPMTPPPHLPPPAPQINVVIIFDQVGCAWMSRGSIPGV